MQVYYDLSDKQLDLFYDDQRYVLAIPLLSHMYQSPDDTNKETPDEYAAKIRQYVFDSLPQLNTSELKDDVGACLVTDVWVHLLNRGGGSKKHSRALTATQGDIVASEHAWKYPCYQMPVVVIPINGGSKPARWPGGNATWVRTDREGMIYPKQKNKTFSH